MQTTLDAPKIFANFEDASLFEQAPIALWAEDFSALKQIFEEWRQAGVSDITAHLAAGPGLVKNCTASIRVRQVNQRALEMLGAADLAELIRNLPNILRDDALPAYVQELRQLWAGKTRFSTKSVNYRLDGTRLDIRLNGVILPGYEADWSRVIVAIEDVTAEEAARRELIRSELFARALFNDSPVSLWVEDFSAIRQLLAGLRARGITDFQTFIDVHPDFVERCMREIQVIDVNQHTLGLFGAPDRNTLLSRLGDMFRDEMLGHFGLQLVELWNGKLRHEREVVNYTLAGEPLNLILQFSVMPGHEADWSRVLVALTDITARKKAEAYLEYLGKHDVLTGLYNRTFYVEEVNRLDRRGPYPVSVVMLDLNGLKLVNDEHGHAQGDAMLRRAGEVLAQTVDKPGCVARVGGDEFVLLLPATGAAGVAALLDNLARIIDLNNAYHSAAPALSFAIGAATAAPGERLEGVIQRADTQMYARKREFYVATPEMDRRG